MRTARIEIKCVRCGDSATVQAEHLSGSRNGWRFEAVCGDCQNKEAACAQRYIRPQGVSAGVDEKAPGEAQPSLAEDVADIAEMMASYLRCDQLGTIEKSATSAARVAFHYAERLDGIRKRLDGW